MFSACPIFKPEKPFWYVCNTSDCNILRWDILTEGFCHLKLRHWDFLSPKLALVGNCSWSGGWRRQNTLFLHGASFLRRRTNCSIQKLWHDAHVSIPCYVYALINLQIIRCWIKYFTNLKYCHLGMIPVTTHDLWWPRRDAVIIRPNISKYMYIMYIIYFITCIYSIKWVCLKIGYLKIRWIIIMFPIRMTLWDVTIFSHAHTHTHTHFAVRKIQQNHFWPLQPPALPHLFEVRGPSWRLLSPVLLWTRKERVKKSEAN